MGLGFGQLNVISPNGCFLICEVNIMVAASSWVIVRVEVVLGSTENRSLQRFSVKDQIVNILGSVGHRVSAKLLRSAVVTGHQPETICK